MKYTVHHYLPVIVTVHAVEAESMEKAIEQSMGEAMRFAEENFTTEARGCGNIKQTQFADGHLGALVDVDGDEQYLETTFLGSDEAASFLPEGAINRG